MASSTAALSASSTDSTVRLRVTVQQYIAFRRDGFLAVPGLVTNDQIAELRQHTEDLMQGRLPEQRQEMGKRDTGTDHGTLTQALECCCRI